MKASAIDTCEIDALTKLVARLLSHHALFEGLSHRLTFELISLETNHLLLFRVLAALRGRGPAFTEGPELSIAARISVASIPYSPELERGLGRANVEKSVHGAWKPNWELPSVGKPDFDPDVARWRDREEGRGAVAARNAIGGAIAIRGGRSSDDLRARDRDELDGRKPHELEARANQLGCLFSPAGGQAQADGTKGPASAAEPVARGSQHDSRTVRPKSAVTYGVRLDGGVVTGLHAAADRFLERMARLNRVFALPEPSLQVGAISAHREAVRGCAAIGLALFDRGVKAPIALCHEGLAHRELLSLARPHRIDRRSALATRLLAGSAVGAIPIHVTRIGRRRPRAVGWRRAHHVEAVTELAADREALFDSLGLRSACIAEGGVADLDRSIDQTLAVTSGLEALIDGAAALLAGLEGALLAQLCGVKGRLALDFGVSVASLELLFGLFALGRRRGRIARRGPIAGRRHGLTGRRWATHRHSLVERPALFKTSGHRLVERTANLEAFAGGAKRLFELGAVTLQRPALLERTLGGLARLDHWALALQSGLHSSLAVLLHLRMARFGGAHGVLAFGRRRDPWSLPTGLGLPFPTALIERTLSLTGFDERQTALAGLNARMLRGLLRGLAIGHLSLAGGFGPSERRIAGVRGFFRALIEPGARRALTEAAVGFWMVAATVRGPAVSGCAVVALLGRSGGGVVGRRARAIGVQTQP